MLNIPITYPTEVLAINKFEVPEDRWSEWSENAKKAFNYLHEMMERNQEAFYATDLFPITEYTTENKIIFHKIMNACNWNAAWEIADYINGGFPSDPTELERD